MIDQWLEYIAEFSDRDMLLESRKIVGGVRESEIETRDETALQQTKDGPQARQSLPIDHQAR